MQAGKPTPCADAKTLIEIVWLIPGAAAREFRRNSARTVCRVLGGDESIIQEIEERHVALQSSAEGKAAQQFMLTTADTAPAAKRMRTDLPQELQLATTQDQKSQYFELWMNERRMEVREKAQRQQLGVVKEGMQILASLGVSDDRDKIACSDLVRRIMQEQPTPAAACAASTQLAVATYVEDPSTPTPECAAHQRGEEISMHSVAAKLGLRIPHGKSGLIGKAIKKHYALKYGKDAASKIPKRNIPFQGSIFPENAYWSRDEALLETAIKETLSK